MSTEDYVEDLVRPVPLWGMLILWSACGYCMVSAVALFLCDPVTDWGLLKYDSYGSALFCGGIAMLLFVVFTLYFILFRGIRFRIYPERIEYQRGCSFVPFAPEVTTLDFADLKAIRWQIRDDNPTEMAHIELIFSNRRWPFQLHKPFRLNSPVAEACKRIERDILAPRMLCLIENGETLSFTLPGRYPSYDIRIDAKTIADWDQNRLNWSDIDTVLFSRGESTGDKDYIAQCRISLSDRSGAALSFDMPSKNPHALWAVLLQMIEPERVAVIDAPKDAHFQEAKPE